KLSYTIPRDSNLTSFIIERRATDIYTLSLHDALPISGSGELRTGEPSRPATPLRLATATATIAGPRRIIQCSVTSLRASSVSSRDRKSTRLNSSHVKISYAVFCLKKKNKEEIEKSHHK